MWFPVNRNQLPLCVVSEGITSILGGCLLDFFCHSEAICIWIVGNDQGLSFRIGGLNREVQSPGLFRVWKLDGGKFGIWLLLGGDNRVVLNS